MNVREAITPAETEACFPILQELRPEVDRKQFNRRVSRQREDGYRLLYVENDGQPIAVAGFRISEMLSRGRFLYVDDLVTLKGERRRGYGTRLLEEMTALAREEGCSSIDLDSGFDRKQAHRFYLSGEMEITALHFRKRLD